MNLSLDYDDTYTRDPSAWDEFIELMRRKGHKVYLVTWRKPGESAEVYLQLQNKVDGIYCTSRVAKEKYMYSQGIRIDVWIDDMPFTILESQTPIITFGGQSS